MFQLGNRFGARSKPQPEPIPSPSPATLSDPQEALDLASKAHEMKRAELTAAREQLARKEQRLGEQLADGIDSGPEILSMQAAQLTIKHLETTVEVLSQRQQHAQRALTDATRAKAEATLAAACARVTALSPRGEELLAAVTQYCTELAAALDTLRRVGGNEEYSYRTREIQLQFGLFLGLTKYALTNTHNSTSQALSPFMKYPSWTDCLEKNCG